METSETDADFMTTDPLSYDELVAIITKAGFTPRSYSGRHMYGKECVALSLAAQDYRRIALMLYEACRATASISRIFQGLQVEELGKGAIVYWPATEWRG